MSRNLFGLVNIVGNNDTNMRIKISDIAQNVVEELRMVDYTKYYDTKGISMEAADALYTPFSKKSIISAQKSLDKFLTYVPRDVYVRGKAKFEALKRS